MGDLIRLDDRIYTWTQAYALDKEETELDVHVDRATGHVDITQINSEGEAIRVVLTASEFADLVSAVNNARAPKKAR